MYVYTGLYVCMHAFPCTIFAQPLCYAFRANLRDNWLQWRMRRRAMLNANWLMAI